MSEQITKSEDLHARTAELFSVPEQVTQEQRRLAKCVNFGKLYGNTDFFKTSHFSDNSADI